MASCGLPNSRSYDDLAKRERPLRSRSSSGGTSTTLGGASGADQLRKELKGWPIVALVLLPGATRCAGYRGGGAECGSGRRTGCSAAAGRRHSGRVGGGG